MGTTTRQILRQRLKQNFGDYNTLTATAQGNADKKDWIASALAELTANNNAFDGWWGIGTSGTNDGDIRRIPDTGYAASSTTLDVQVALSLRTESGDTFEISRINPTDYHNAINRAIETLFPSLYLPLRDESLIVDSLLLNGGFETLDSGSPTFDNWVEVGSPVVTAETTRVYHGTNSAKVVASGADGQLTQAPSVNIPEIAGKTALFKCWAWADTALKVRLRLDWDGSSFENGDFHTGDSSWRQLTVSGSVPSTATQVKTILEVVNGSTGYFDLGWLAVGNPIHKYTIPTSFLLGPHRIGMQHNINNVDGPYYELPQFSSPKQGRLLRLQGMGLLSRPTTDTGTVEVDGARVNLIVAKATEWLATTLSRREAGGDVDRWRAIRLDASDEVRSLIARPGIKMMAMGAEIPRGTWHTEEDSAGRYIIFDRVRQGVATVG